MLSRFRLSLTTRSVLTVCVAAMVIIGASSWWAKRMMVFEIDAAQSREAHKHLNFLSESVEKAIKGLTFTRKDGDVIDARIETIPDFADHTLIDGASVPLGGVATIFRVNPQDGKYLRISTSLKKENGERALGTALADDHPAQPFLKRGEVYEGPAVLFGKSYYTYYLPTKTSGGAVNGMFFIGVPSATYVAIHDAAFGRWLMSTAMAVLAAMLIGGFMVRSLTKPLSRLSTRVVQLSEGDFESAVPMLKRRDEFGRLAQSIEGFRTSNQQKAVLEAANAEQAAEILAGREALDKALSAHRSEITLLMRSLIERSGAMLGSAGKLDILAGSVDEALNLSEEHASQTTLNVATVATAVDELVATIAEISSQVDQARRSVESGVSDSAEAQANIAKLSDSVATIGSVVTLIRGIADQTNLLALNATIEAARAGEQGRGFAVVANEVKALAGQTAQATETITAQIAMVQDVTEAVVKAIGNVAERMAGIDMVTMSIASGMVQQSATTNEIAKSASAAADGTREVVEKLTVFGAMVDETRQSVEAVGTFARHVDADANSVSELFDRLAKRLAEKAA
jgi:methyl-accepting chemotaxis protein